jgi:hypothetical protein
MSELFRDSMYHGVRDLALRLLDLEKNMGAGGSAIKGDDNKKYKVVACALRNTGSGWYAITDANHDPVGISSITNDTMSITVNYDFTAKTVGTLVCTPDETYVQQGYNFGATVGKTFSKISIERNRTIGGYISYNGTSWVINGDKEGISSVSFTGGILTITHEDIGTSFARNCSCRNGVYLADIGTTGATTTQIYIKDYAGTLVSTPDSNMRIFFNAITRPAANPNDLTNVGGNIWVYGIFEVE